MEKYKPEKKPPIPRLLRHKEDVRILSPEKRKITIEKFKKPNLPNYYNEGYFFH